MYLTLQLASTLPQVQEYIINWEQHGLNELITSYQPIRNPFQPIENYSKENQESLFSKKNNKHYNQSVTNM